MAAAQPLPEPPGEPATEPGVPEAMEPAEETALVPAGAAPEAAEFIPSNSPLARLPVEVDVSVPVRKFRVRHLLALQPGEVIETQWANGEDMPLAAGQVQLAWSEFEVIDTQLAVRVTRLA
jgi:flagellar motor switch/type III secretory pathway protein FliN